MTKKRRVVPGCPVLPVPTEAEAAYAYLLGMYLGDGYIARIGSTWCLRIYLDSTQPAVIERCANAITTVNAFHKLGRQQRDAMTIVRSYGACWLSLFPQHGPGYKHQRRIVLEDWQRAIIGRQPASLVRGLLESDGCRFDRVVNGIAYPSYQFTNRSTDILEIFCWSCELLGLHYTRPTAVNVSIARRRDVGVVDAFVGPKN